MRSSAHYKRSEILPGATLLYCRFHIAIGGSVRKAKSKYLAAVSFVCAVLMVLMPFGHGLSVIVPMNANSGVTIEPNSNSTAVNISMEEIQTLLLPFNVSTNYSQVDTIHAVLYNSTNLVEVNATGSLMLNNTTYRYDFHLQNTSQASTVASLTFLQMVNETNVSYTLPPPLRYYYKWTNTTTLNATLFVRSSVSIQNATTSNNTLFVNRSLKADFLESTGYDGGVHSTTYTNSSSSFYNNETFSTTNNITSVLMQFSTPKTTGAGNLTISYGQMQFNSSSNSESMNATFSSGNFTGTILNHSAQDTYNVSISQNVITMSVNADPVVMTVDPSIKVTVKNNALCVILEVDNNVGSTGENIFELGFSTFGAILFGAALSSVTDVGIPAAAGYAASEGIDISIGAIYGSAAGISTALGAIAVVVIAAITISVTYDLINHPNGSEYTMYVEDAADWRYNVPWWSFWPPKIGAYGELGAKVSWWNSGVGLNVYYPALSSQWPFGRHYGLMPSNLPPWWWGA